MTYKGKIINALELAKKQSEENGLDRIIVPFKETDMILELLKEQEAKPVYLYGKADWYDLVCICPDCKAEWMGDESNTHFCPNCGRKVKWE